jgi:4-amino-4-deoxy-L-arabinose transferase-like glycosyltransferase
LISRHSNWVHRIGYQRLLGVRRFVIPVLFLVASLPYFMQIVTPNYILASRDEYRYAILADSLSGRFANAAHLPLPIQHPWGWPVLIYLGRIVTGHTTSGGHLVSSALAVLVGALTYWLLRRYTSQVVALTLGLLVSTNPLLVSYADRLLSEPAFMVAYLVGLLLAVQEEGRLRRNYGRLAAVGLPVVIITSLRTVGAIFVIAALLALFDAFVRSKETIFSRSFLGGALLLAAPVLAFLAITSLASPAQGVNADSGYYNQFLHSRTGTNSQGELRGLWERTEQDFLQHGADYVGVFQELRASSLLPGFKAAQVIDNVVWYLLAFLALTGLAWRFYRHRGLVEWFTLLYLLAFFIWPYFSNRFFLPILPLLLWFATWPLLRLAAQRTTWKGILLSVGLVLLLGSWVQSLSQATAGREPHAETMESLQSAAAYLRNTVAESDIIGTAYSFELYYFAPGLTMVQVPADPDSAKEALMSKRATYALFPISDRESTAAHEQDYDLVEPPLEFGDFVVYHVRSAP